MPLAQILQVVMKGMVNIKMINNTDLKHLRRCVELAKISLEKGDEPFGSILVSSEGKVLAEDHNHVAAGDHTQCALQPMVGLA